MSVRRTYVGGLALFPVLFISTYILGSEGQFWTAGNDIQTEKEWIWAGNNEHITGYTNWAPGEPNQINGEEDCLTIYPRKGYHWNDAQCDKSMNYICEHL